MKSIFITLLTVSTIYFSGCSKNHQIPAVTGNINGVPALTLYGSGGGATDYILLVDSLKELSYQVQDYYYNINAATNDIYIIVSITNVIKGTLTTSGNKTTLTIDTQPQNTFVSKQYTSR